MEIKQSGSQRSTQGPRGCFSGAARIDPGKSVDCIEEMTDKEYDARLQTE
jgi:hypothetical protein